jgi:hypothetical protein
MTRDRFRTNYKAIALAITRDHDSPSYDKLYKLKWILDEVLKRFKAMWSSNQQFTADEDMHRYKGWYFPMKQYMPKKPMQIGIKIWAASIALTKYL